jgi:hypothetical protein
MIKGKASGAEDKRWKPTRKVAHKRATRKTKGRLSRRPIDKIIAELLILSTLN